MEPVKTDEQAKFSSMLDGIRSNVLVMVVDATILDLVLAEEDLNGNADKNRG
ncbi:MAG: hypothetical protein ACFFD4_04295 [Candidatus Odinarchaeota archaeon]